ncbi:MAG: NAD(P)-dependent oxidoreductase [Persephonella sp.]|nr:MAG: NAD(P)-dependent oxidoreductase [Persephonella sp.]
MSILITGGAGFIGSTLGLNMLKKGEDIYFLDIKDKPNFIPNDRYFNIDITDKNSLEDVFKNIKFDGIIHLAAISRVVWGEEEPEKCKKTNIEGTNNILSLIAKYLPKSWFIFGSSREVYGEAENLPVKEDDPKKPINIYGRTKLEGENLTIKYSQEYGINSVILRFSNVYGNERDILDRVIPKFIISALKNEPLTIQGGTQIFDFTYIDYTIEGIKKTIELLNSQSKQNGYIDDFHILTGKPKSIVDLAEMIIDYTNSSSEIVYLEGRYYDVDKFYGDIKKIRNVLGIGEPIYLEDGLKKTVKLYREIFV